MKAEIVDLAKWKKAHPPPLIFFNHALACAVAWQKLWFKVLYGPSK